MHRRGRSADGGLELRGAGEEFRVEAVTPAVERGSDLRQRREERSLPCNRGAVREAGEACEFCSDGRMDRTY